MKKFKFSQPVIIFLAMFLPVSFAVYNLPAVQERLDWRVAELTARIKYALSPPEEVIFVPQEAAMLSTETVPSAPPSPLPPPEITVTTTPPALSTPAVTPTPIPQSIQLAGFKHEYQTWNNCGPATLAIALSFWGWEGDQRSIATYTKPNPRDKNVMPYEMAAYVEDETDLEIVYRVGGDVELLRHFLVSGLPVIIEKGFEGPDFDGWMGHYVLVTGYDDSDQRFTLQDSYYGPDQVMGYEELESYWRGFNFTYLVVFPAERRVEIESILGPHMDDEHNNRYAAQKASDDIYTLTTSRDQFFAWFNRGTNLMRLQDYAGAAKAYDQAFALYPTIPGKERPWRMMWYQTGPYWAYYYTGRYLDVIALSTTTLDAMSEPVLEESYYWRALAYEALGDTAAAVKDLQTALKVHPGFGPADAKLEQMGVSP